MRWYLIVGALVVGWGGVVVNAQGDKPVSKFPIGRETSYITEPLDENGYLDYQTALNERLRKGITPENNANVLLWRAIGPHPERYKMPPAYFKWLGIEEPPAEGDYFLPLHQYLRERARLQPNEWQEIYDQLDQAVRRPWAAMNYPLLADWLLVNEKPLVMVTEACQRPQYYNPTVKPPSDSDPGIMVLAILPNVQFSRELARALAARAMLRVKEGKLEEAWQDLRTGHRLGRHIARGSFFIESLVGFAIERLISAADLAYLQHPDLTARQIQRCLQDLQRLPPLPALADKIEWAERLVYLETMQYFHRDFNRASKQRVFAELTLQKYPKIDQLKVLALDWEPALRSGNRWHDRLAAAIRMPNYAARQMEFDKIDKECNEIDKMWQNRWKKLRITLGLVSAQEIPQMISDIWISWMIPATRSVSQAGDRAEQEQWNLHVAFALEAYRRDKGRYPAKLEELAPKYLPEVPNDLFSTKLIYCRTEEGYVLYSVGPNGKDDGGRGPGDDPPRDDMVIRMPPEQSP